MKKESIFILIFIFMINSVCGLSFDNLGGAYNLADTITISGSSEESGFLFLTLKCGEDSSIIGDGEIYVENKFSKEVTLEKEGECKIIGDINGNSYESGVFIVGNVEETSSVEESSDVVEEEIVVPVAEQSILISASLSEVNYEPGDKIVISGIVDRPEATVVANIDGKQFVSIGEEFKFVYELPRDVKSGRHEILVEAKDELGHFGSMVLNYNIQAIPSDLAFNLNSNYNPGDELSILVNLYDQAGELISGNYIIEIYDGWTKSLDEEHVLNEEFKLKLPEYAKPGSRKVNIKAFELTNNKEFVVNEVKKLDISLNGDILVIKNVGNVYFNDELAVNGYSIRKSRKLYLDVGESTELDLSSLFDEAVYDISIPLTGQTFNGVSVDKSLFAGVSGGLGVITGGVVYNVKGAANKYSYFILIGLILFVVCLIFLNRWGKLNLKKRARQKEFMEGQKRLREIARLKGSTHPYSRKYNFGKASDEDVEYFKRKVVSDYNKKENPPKGLFSMFR